MEEQKDNKTQKKEEFVCKMDINLLWYPSFLREDLEYIERDIKEGLTDHLLSKIRQMRSTLDGLEKAVNKEVENSKKMEERNNGK